MSAALIVNIIGVIIIRFPLIPFENAAVFHNPDGIVAKNILWRVRIAVSVTLMTPLAPYVAGSKIGNKNGKFPRR